MTQEREGDSTLWFLKDKVKGQSSEGLGKRGKRLNNSSFSVVSGLVFMSLFVIPQEMS